MTRPLIDRRTLLAGLGASALVATPARAHGVDALSMGLRPGAPDDQTRALQQAIERTAGARLPLFLPPGTYRVGELKLPAHTHIVGSRGATRLVFAGAGEGIFTASQLGTVTLENLVLEGATRRLPERRGLATFNIVRNLVIAGCEILASGGEGLMLTGCDGRITDTTIAGAARAALFSLDARGLTIERNTIRGAGDNGILVWRSEPGDDGTVITGNRIEDIAARSGGSGQNGNAINVFRAGNVMVSGNRIKGAAFSAVRGNAASNLSVIGNTAIGCGEVAIYAEFGFEGAVIASNLIDGAAIGVSVTNFNEGGRLAAITGNLIRNLHPQRPAGTDPGDAGGIGISVEADAAVTGNVIENAPTAGVLIGWGQYMRDVAVTGNVVRNAGIGVAVSVTRGAGQGVIADNLIAGTRRGAVIGVDHLRPVTPELATEAPGRLASLSISGNRVR